MGYLEGEDHVRNGGSYLDISDPTTAAGAYSQYVRQNAADLAAVRTRSSASGYSPTPTAQTISSSGSYSYTPKEAKPAEPQKVTIYYASPEPVTWADVDAEQSGTVIAWGLAYSMGLAATTLFAPGLSAVVALGGIAAASIATQFVHGIGIDKINQDFYPVLPPKYPPYPAYPVPEYNAEKNTITKYVSHKNIGIYPGVRAYLLSIPFGMACGAAAFFGGKLSTGEIGAFFDSWRLPVSLAAGFVFSLGILGADAYKDKLEIKSGAKAMLGAALVAGGVYGTSLVADIKPLFGAQSRDVVEPVRQYVAPPVPVPLPPPPSPYVVPPVPASVPSRAKVVHPDVFVAITQANVRLDPKPDGKIIATAACGARLSSENGISGKWTAIPSSEGIDFYIWSGSLSATKPPICRPS